MRSHFEKLKTKYLFSEETHNILNLATLDIHDKEIATEYELFRIKRFNGLFWPLICVFVLYNLFGWLSYFLSGGELGEALRPLHQWVIVLILLIPRLFFKRYTPQSWILANFPTLLLVQFAIRGYIPGQDTPRQLAQYDLMFIFVLLFSFVGNYNTFKLTLLTLPAIHVTFFYL